MKAKLPLAFLLLGFPSILFALQFLNQFLFQKSLLLPANVAETKYSRYRKRVVINLGLPKTGTTSLFKEWKSIFKKTNMQASHWDGCYSKEEPRHWNSYDCQKGVTMCARGIFRAIAGGNRNPLELIRDDIRVFCQMDCIDWDIMMFPQIDLLDYFLSYFSPDEAIFVLTTRDSLKWFDSVSRWSTMRARFMHHLRKRDESFYDERDEVLKKLETSKLNNWIEGDEDLSLWKNDTDLRNVHEEMLIRFKEEHERNVLQKAAEKGHKVFILDLERPDLLQQKIDEVVELFFHGKSVNLPEHYSWSNKNKIKPKLSKSEVPPSTRP